MKCQNCNNEIPDGTQFCGVCGAPANGQAPQTSQPQYQQNTAQPQYQQNTAQPQYQQNMAQPQYQQPYGMPVQQKKSYARPVSLVGFIVLLISMFVPYASATVFYVTENVSLIEGDGLVLIPFIILGIILAAIKKIKGTIVPIAVMVIYFIYSLFNINSDELGGIMKFEAGFYLMMIGIVITIVAFIMHLSANKK